MTATSDADLCQVERFQVHCLVPARYPAPHRVEGRLEALLRDALPRALGAALAWGAGSRDEVWVIRRLDLNLDLNLACDDGQLACRWAGCIVKALADILSGAGGEGAIRFPSRAAYLARFLADVADGRAWGRWFYEPFLGLKALPVSAAIRTAVEGDPDGARPALALLERQERSRVVRALLAQDAGRVTAALDDGAGDPSAGREDVQRWLDGIACGWAECGGEVAALGDEQATLWVVLTVLRTQPAAAGLTVAARAAAALARFGRGQAGARTPGAALPRLLRALAENRVTEVCHLVGVDGLQTLRPLLGYRRELLDTFAGAPAERPGAGGAQPGAHRGTPFGGAFLLLPVLNEIPFDEAAAGWPSLDDAPASGVLRLLVLARCLGGARRRAACHDPVLCDVMQVTPRAVEELPRWLAGITPEQANALREGINLWQRAARLAGGDDPLTTTAHRGNSEVRLLADRDTGAWLDLSVTDSPADQGAPREGVPADLEYLWAGAAQEMSSRVEAVLTVCAQSVLRAFARRLPGFATASLPYLRANFLDVPASVEQQPGRWVVRLGRPPLHVVLHLAGLSRTRCRPSWLGGEAVELFPAE